jgi:acetoin utilization deacetylase AcuC-like enzyme
MKIYYSDAHRKHFPPFEVFDGGKRVPYFENPERMDRILAALNKTDWAELVEPADFGLEPILAVHDGAYINFLASCWTEWLASDPEVAAAPETHAFLPATFALRCNPRVPHTLLGKAGYYIGAPRGQGLRGGILFHQQRFCRRELAFVKRQSRHIRY